MLLISCRQFTHSNSHTLFRTREPLVAPPAEPVAAFPRLARCYRHDRAHLDRPVGWTCNALTIRAQVPAPAVGGDHPGYLKACVREPLPPGNLFQAAWSAVAHLSLP